MDSTDFLLVSVVIVGLALVLAAATWQPPKKKKPPPQESTRWKRLRVKPARLQGALDEAKSAVVEDPKGLKLLALPRSGPQSAKRVALASPDGRVRLEIRRRWQPFRWQYRASLGRQPLFDLLVTKKTKKSHRKLELRHPAPAEPHRLRGSFAEREYQILRQGKLVANVSWQHYPDEPEPAEEYIVEVLKGEDVLSLLGIALAVELAMG